MGKSPGTFRPAIAQAVKIFGLLAGPPVVLFATAWLALWAGSLVGGSIPAHGVAISLPLWLLAIILMIIGLILVLAAIASPIYFMLLLMPPHHPPPKEARGIWPESTSEG